MPRAALYTVTKLYVGRTGFRQNSGSKREIGSCSLGHAILEKMRGNYDESERIFNYLISEMPRDWILYEGRADLYFMMGKNARAMADIEKVFTESEPTANLYVLRGKIKLAQYEKERAALDFKKAESMGYNKEVIKELLKLTMNN